MQSPGRLYEAILIGRMKGSWRLGGNGSPSAVIRQPSQSTPPFTAELWLLRQATTQNGPAARDRQSLALDHIALHRCFGGRQSPL
jgi:hypothetical protein